MKDEVIRKTKDLCASTLDGISVECSILGVKVRRQLKKFLISKGGPWGALAFLFQDNDGEEKLMLASFRSDGNLFRRYSYFIIRNKEEAEKVCKIIKESFNVENDSG